MLVSHISAAYRLRRAAGLTANGEPVPVTALASELARSSTTLDCEGTAKAPVAEVSTVRDAAIRSDRLETGHGHNAQVDVWAGVVTGKWSMLDWFDANGRRFVLARPTDPAFGDPRALTPREQQVVLCVARGSSGKETSYELGISPTRVSVLLRSAMRKLRAKTQAELIMKIRSLEGQRRAHAGQG